MYSIVLMMAMTSPADVPQGILFNRQSSGCSGTSRAFPIIGGFLARVNEVRPKVFGARVFVAPQSSGCSGSSAATTYSETDTTTFSSAGGTPTTVSAQGMFLQRAAVNRVLHRALRQGTVTPAQAKIVKQALEDPDIYAAAVTKVHRDLVKQSVSAQAIGDGRLLQLLLDNLPKIIDAIKQIIELFGASPHWGEESKHLVMTSPSNGGFLPLPLGPYPPSRAFPPPSVVNLAC